MAYISLFHITDSLHISAKLYTVLRIWNVFAFSVAISLRSTGICHVEPISYSHESLFGQRWLPLKKNSFFQDEQFFQEGEIIRLVGDPDLLRRLIRESPGKRH